MNDATPQPEQDDEAPKGTARAVQAVKEAPLGLTASVVLAAIFGASQAISGVQVLLDSRYSKREELTRVEVLSGEILRRLDRIEKKIDGP